MKKLLCVLLAALLLIAGCGVAEEPAADPEAGFLYTAEPSASSGGYCVLTMKDELRLTPDDTFEGPVTWTSEDPAVATVGDGLVLPVGPGITEIRFTDGAAEGFCFVLVDDMPAELTPAGALHIELDGETYQSGFCTRDWEAAGEFPHKLTGTGDNWVYTDGSRYYVRSEFLLNIVCCALGKSHVLKGIQGELPQLYGQYAIGEDDADPEVILCGEHIMLVTFPWERELPEGTRVSRNIYTLIAQDDEVVDMVPYGYTVIDDRSYEDAADYLDRYGVGYELEYDAEQSVLTVKLTKEGA